MCEIEIFVVVLLDIAVTVLLAVVLSAWLSFPAQQFERLPVNPSVRHDSEQEPSDVVLVP